jgi:hypothetical protein
LPLHFDFEAFHETQTIDNQYYALIIQYIGTSKPTVIDSKNIATKVATS